MKKKVMTMVLAASMLLGMAGCGVHLQMTVQQQMETQQEGIRLWQEQRKMMRQVMQKVVHKREHLLSGLGSFNVDAMKEAGKLYQKDHPDVNINVVETVSSDIQTLVQTYAMSGELDALPDIFLMDDQVFAKYLQNYPDVFADLTDSGIAFADFAEAKVAIP